MLSWFLKKKNSSHAYLCVDALFPLEEIKLAINSFKGRNSLLRSILRSYVVKERERKLVIITIIDEVK